MGVYRKDGDYHKVRKTKSSSMPQRAIFFDSETDHITVNDRELHTLRLAWTFYYRSDRYDIENQSYWKRYLHQTELWEYVLSRTTKDHPLYLFAHNLFFDLQACGFFPFFTERGWEREFHYFDNGNYVLVISKDGSRIRCISTTNYFDFPLAYLGRVIGLDKGEVDFNTASFSQLSDYCKNDTEILVRSMVSYWTFLKDHDLGRFAMTRASQSMTAYRHRFMPTELVVHDDNNVIDLERKAYMGGRVEAFYIGELPTDEYMSLDINSMYPFVMKHYEYPTRLIDYKENIAVGELQWLLERFALVAEIHVSTSISALAKRKDGKLIFPRGRFTCHVCTEGLRLAYSQNMITHVNRIAVYEKAKIFDAWIDGMYPLKEKYSQEGNKIYTLIVKRLLNSLYGKFGQTLPDEIVEKSPSPTGYWRMNGFSLVTGEHIVETQVLNRYSQSTGRVSSPKAMYSIAAHVTENARLLLWKIIDDIGIDRVLYVDTDSLKIRASDVNMLDYPIHPTQLGALAIEKTFHGGHIYGAKDLILDGEVTLKGIPSKAKEIKPNVFTFSYFPGQATHLRMKISDRYVVEHRTKTLKRTYDKGIVTDSGRVVPFELEE